ncbi:hypothetical protein STEG23_007597 [Scotinomys teguina]
MLFTNLMLMGFTGRCVEVYQSNGDGVNNRKRSRKMDKGYYTANLFSPSTNALSAQYSWELKWKLISSPCTRKQHTGFVVRIGDVPAHTGLPSASDAQFGHDVGYTGYVYTQVQPDLKAVKRLRLSQFQTLRNKDTQNQIQTYIPNGPAEDLHLQRHTSQMDLRRLTSPEAYIPNGPQKTYISRGIHPKWTSEDLHLQRHTSQMDLRRLTSPEAYIPNGPQKTYISRGHTSQMDLRRLTSPEAYIPNGPQKTYISRGIHPKWTSEDLHLQRHTSQMDLRRLTSPETYIPNGPAEDVHFHRQIFPNGPHKILRTKAGNSFLYGKSNFGKFQEHDQQQCSHRPSGRILLLHGASDTGGNEKRQKDNPQPRNHSLSISVLEPELFVRSYLTFATQLLFRSAWKVTEILARC